ncbi:cytochrome P450 52A12 [Periconia macrospinosa]|uniref:Cytochrome P450 52A12 n=1 Tax=Periconia macrospinosa TaxID=97972 RepID=A0A2V1EA09_9PLEO|nr:cytochrome P450 52A12 [Periconia macrospinosa]
MEKIWEKEGRVIPTMSEKIAGMPLVITVDPKNVQAVLATKFKDFGLGEFRFKSFYPMLGSGIFTTDGEQWAHARAMLRPQFARDQVSDLDLEEKHIQHLLRHVPVNSDGWTDIINIQPLFFRLTLDSATEFLFGESVNSQLSNVTGDALDESSFSYAFDNGQRALSESFMYGEKFYWLRYGKEFKQHVKICHDFVDFFVAKALNQEKSSAGTTSAGKKKFVFVEALAESTRDPIELRNHLINILLAGRDTTASSLSFTFLELIRNPHIYAKLRAVILEHFGTYQNPRNITFESLKGCNYLQWLLQESLRLYPVVPMDSRTALQDTSLPTGGGPDGTKPIYIRKGVQVQYPLYHMHRRIDFWGEDANEFKPERWEGRRTGWEYLPFNGGPRICIGQQFALTEAAYVIVRLLQRFEACEGVGNTWEPVEKGGYGFVRWSSRLTGAPADGVKIRFKEATGQ